MNKKEQGRQNSMTARTNYYFSIEYLLGEILQMQMDKQVKDKSLLRKSHLIKSISNSNGLLLGVNITGLAKLFLTWNLELLTHSNKRSHSMVPVSSYMYNKRWCLSHRIYQACNQIFFGEVRKSEPVRGNKKKKSIIWGHSRIFLTIFKKSPFSLYTVLCPSRRVPSRRRT